jgi:uncharacterized protein
MRPRLTPTEIVLKDLPPEGRDFRFTRESGELNSKLEDLVGSNPYEVTFKILPMGNVYVVRGDIRTAMDLQCSLCGGDFKFKVNQPINELIVPQKPLGKGDSQVRSNHAHELAEGGPDYILLEGEVFDAGEYIHEAVALAEPIRPVGKPDCDPLCGDEAKPVVERPWLSYGNKSEKPGEGIRANPFQVLEKMKLKG